MKKILTLIISVLFTICLSAQDVTFTIDVDTACVPHTITVTNTSPDTTGKEYFWNFSDGNWYADTGLVYMHTFERSGYFNVELIEDNNGHQYSDPVNVVVMGADSFNMSTGTEACPGEEIEFAAYNDNYKWMRWEWGDGSEDYWNYASHVYNTNGIKNITLYYNSELCGTDTVTQSINITNTATPANIEYIAQDRSEHCPGDEISFNFDRRYGRDYDSVLWDFGDNTFSNEYEPKHSYLYDGYKKIKLEVWNMCGNSIKDSIILKINKNIAANAGFGWDENMLCPNNGITFQTDNSGSSYSWDFGDGSTSIQSKPTHYFTDTGSYDVKLIIENSCGNIDSTTNTIYIDYDLSSDKPESKFRFEGMSKDKNSLTICPEQQLQFENESDYWMPVTSIWDFGDGKYAYDKNAKHIFEGTGTFEVKLITLTNCGVSDTAIKTVIVDPNGKPEVEIMDLIDTICAGEKFYYVIDENLMESGDYTFSIYFGDGDSIVNTVEPNDDMIPVFSHTYETPGTYIYHILTTNVCGNTDTITDTVYVVGAGDFNAFRFIGNSTMNVQEPGLDLLPDYSTPNGPDDHIFIVPLTWNVWRTGMDENFYFIFSLEELNDNPNIIAIAQKTGLGIDTLYVPANQDSIYLACVWYCNGVLGGEPNAASYSYGFKLTAGDTTRLELPGIELVGYNWNGTCNDQSGCPGDTVMFFALGGLNYEWNFGDGSPNEYGSIIHHIYADTGVYDAYCLVTSGCGKTDTVSTPVIIGSYNIPDLDFDVEDEYICANQSILFTARQRDDFFGDAHNETFLWNFDDGTTSTEANPYHTFTEPGNYEVTVTASNGCGIGTKERTIRVEAPYADFAAVDSMVNFGQPVTFINLSDGGTSSHWSFGDFTGSSHQNPSHTYGFPGIYDVTLTVTSQRGCTISKKKDNYIRIISVPRIIDSVIEQISCNGEYGSIDITVTGGLPPYIYEWSHAGFNAEEDQDELSAGTYTVTITDSKDYTAHGTYTINEPSAIIVSKSVSAYPTCVNSSDGKASINISGGTPPYAVLWNTGATTNSINNLSPGLYTVQVEDSNGCKPYIFDTLWLPAQNKQLISFISSWEPSTCGGSDGSLQVNCDGSGDYTYQWNDPGMQSSQIASNLKAGFYSVIVTDNTTSCVDTMLTALGDTADGNIFMYGDYAKCKGDSNGRAIIYDNNKINAPYTVQWSHDASLTGKVAENLPAGDYSALIKEDAESCWFSVNFEVKEPATNLQAIIHTHSPSCENGVDGYAIAEPFGGNGSPYYYEWELGWGDTSSYSGARNVGNHSVKITDNWECQLTKSYTIPNAAPMTVSKKVYDATVRDGKDGVIDLTVTNGTAPYTYLWSNGTNNEDQAMLGAGSYSVTVTDKNGCEVIKESLVVTEPAAIDVKIKADGPTEFCNGQSVSLTTEKGYVTYLWSTGETTRSIVADSGKYYSVSVTNNISNGNDSVYIDVQYPYENEEICMVTIDLETGKNMVVWEKTPNKGTAGYIVYRESSTAGVFDSIGYVPYDSVTTFVDLTSKPENYQHIYKISVVDTCENESKLEQTPYHKTLFLQYNGAFGGINLTWKRYEIDGSEIIFHKYYILRGSDSTALQVIDSVSGNNDVYTDNDLQAASGKMFYRVIGVRDVICDPAGLLKASTGPFSQSISNIEDNRLREENFVPVLTGSITNLKTYPNPFKKVLQIEYTINTPGQVLLALYDMYGKQVSIIDTGIKEAGTYTLTHTIEIPGMYLLRLQKDENVVTKKVVGL